MQLEKKKTFEMKQFSTFNEYLFILSPYQNFDHLCVSIWNIIVISVLYRPIYSMNKYDSPISVTFNYAFNISTGSTASARQKSY